MDIRGLKVNFLGDSITEGVGVSDIANCRYVERLAKTWELRTNIYAIGGTRLAHQIQPSEPPRKDLCFCGRAYDMDTTADMVIVYGGVNDYLHGDAPLGQMGDTTPATFYGGVYFLMRYLKENYPNKPVVFMTPARCSYRSAFGVVSYQNPSCYPIKGGNKATLLDYVQAVLETGKLLGIPVLDLYHDLPLDTNDEQIYKTYTVDGLHFNNDGHGILAETLQNFLLSL